MKKYILLACCLFSAFIVFPPMCSDGVSAPTVKLTLIKAKGEVLHLDTERNVEYTREYKVAKIEVPYDDKMLEIPGVGKMGFKDFFYIDYETTMYVPKDEMYVFRVSSDDGFRLKIDGKVVTEHPGNRPYTENKGEMFLDKGEHRVELNYFQAYGPLGLHAAYERKKGGGPAILGKNSGGVKFRFPK